MTIGENIKQLRKKKGLTQKGLGELCGINEANIRKYESGRQNPQVDTIRKISQALEVDYWEIIGFDNISIELHEDTSDNSAILHHYSKLNSIGKEEATKRVEELTYIEKYKK